MVASRTVLNALLLEKERATTAIVMSHTHTIMQLLRVKVHCKETVWLYTICVLSSSISLPCYPPLPPSLPLSVHPSFPISILPYSLTSDLSSLCFSLSLYLHHASTSPLVHPSSICQSKGNVHWNV